MVLDSIRKIVNKFKILNEKGEFFMEREGKVSLWLGNFSDSQSFNDFIEFDYTEDGDLIPSKFQKNFRIGYYDEDFSEIEYFENSFNNLKNILEGFSYDEKIIPQFTQIYQEQYYNCVILLYNFEYIPSIENYTDGDNYLRFIGVADYITK